jgi:hypothetical protein
LNRCGVNYRKFVSPDLDHLLPEDQFRLLAASMYFPRQLAAAQSPPSTGNGLDGKPAIVRGPGGRTST